MILEGLIFIDFNSIVDFFVKKLNCELAIKFRLVEIIVE